MALRYGPLIYTGEAGDQGLDKVLAPDAPLITEWKPDLLKGVLVIKGTWTDVSDLLAIPNYARANRLSSACAAGLTCAPSCTVTCNCLPAWDDMDRQNS